MAFLAIIKDSIAIPSSNKHLFLPLFLLIAVINGALIIWSRLGVEPLAAAAIADGNQLRILSPTSEAYAVQLKKLLADLAKLAAVGAPYLVADLLLAFGLRALAYYAAVDAIRGAGDRTLGSVLQRAGGTIWSPLLTQILVYVFQLGFVLAFAAIAFGFVSSSSGSVLVVLLLVFFLAVLFFIYLSLVFLVSVVVSVDRPDIRGFAAVKRAWGLVGRNIGLGLAVLVFFNIVSDFLSAAFRMDGNAGAVVSVLLWILFLLLAAVVEVVTATGVAAYYEVCVARARDAGEVYEPLPPPASEL